MEGTHQPERVLQDCVLRGRVHSTHHGTDAANQTDAKHDPRICRHKAESEARLEERAGGESGHRETATGVHETLMQVGLLYRREPISCLPVEENVHPDDSPCNGRLQMR